MSNTSYNFKDNLTIDNNKHLKWLDQTGVSRGNVIAVTSTNTVAFNSVFGGEIHINKDTNSLTKINENNTSPVLIVSNLGVGINTTSNMTSTLSLPSNGSIGLNSTLGTLTFAAGSGGSRFIMNAASSGIKGGSLEFYTSTSAPLTTGNILFHTGNDSLKAFISHDGSVSFMPDGSTIRLSITDDKSTFSNPLVLSNTQESTGSSNGALQVAGGISVRGNCFVDGTLSINSASGNINFDSSQASTSSTTGAIYLSGGLGISNTTNATSITSGGGLTVAGGGAIQKSLFVGGPLTIANTTTPTSAENGALIVYGGAGMSGPLLIRSNLSSQVKLAPVSNGNETSLTLYANNTFDNSTTGGSTNWTLAQSSGTFVATNSQIGPAMCIVPNGFVGIGTTAPSKLVDVHGNSRDIRLCGSNPSILVQSMDTQGGTLEIGVSSTSGTFFTSTVKDDAVLKASHSFMFASNNSTSAHLVISTSGNVAVTKSLDIVESAHANTLIATSTSPSTGIGEGALIVQGGASFASNIHIGGVVNAHNTVLLLSTADTSGTSGGALVSYGGVNIICTTDTQGATNGGALHVHGGISISKGVSIGGPICKIPTGSSAQRPNPASDGLIRFNTETSQFEGYGAGNWGSLGGVVDVSQNTKILAELYPGANDGNLRFFTASLERMRINSSGNIGINTTSPASLVDINGLATLTQLSCSVSTISNLLVSTSTLSNILVSNSTFSNTSISQASITNGTIANAIISNANITTITTGSVFASGLSTFNGSIQGLNTSNTLGNLFTYNGNIGISNENPAYKLDVDGTTHITGDLIVDGSIDGSGSSSSTFAYLTLTATDEAINLTTGSLLSFGGITIQCETEATDESNGGGLLVAGGASVSKNLIVGTSLIINSTSNATGVGTGGALTINGGASIQKDVFIGGTLTSASDERLKCNIQSLDNENILEKMLNVRPVRYNFKNDLPSTPQYGFLAQDFEQHFPELLKKPSPDGFYSLDYMKVTVLLLQCIKELQEELLKLKG
jgi:Chaperone of endosialidase